MRMDELKRGFWGYKKDSVYHYIVSLEEKASVRVAEKEAKLEQLEQEMERQLAQLDDERKKQVAELEAKLNALREENSSLRKDQTSVFSTLLEAQKYAEQLRAESERQRQQAQEELSAAIQQKTKQLDDYQDQIQQLRIMIRDLLHEFDGRAGDAERLLAFLPARAPSAELDMEAPGGAAPEDGGISGLVPLSDTGGFPGAGEAPASGPYLPIKAKKSEGKDWKKISFS